MLKCEPYDFFNPKPPNHESVPEVFYEFDRMHYQRNDHRKRIKNGQPYRRHGTSVKTRLYATNFEICMMPMIRIKKKDETSVEAIFELAFNPGRHQKLRGKKLMGEPPTLTKASNR